MKTSLAVHVMAAAIFCLNTLSAADHVVTVASGSTNTVDAAFVTALGDAERLVKRGAGVLVSSAALADYAGEIVVEEGVFIVPETGAVGATAATAYVTVSNGATVVFAAKTANGIKCGKRVVRIAGDGAEGEPGALVFNGASLLAEGCLRYITLMDDSRIRSTSEFTLYNGELDMNGHTLKLSVRNKTASGSTSWDFAFTIHRSRVLNPGNMILETGRLVVGGDPSGTHIPYWEGDEENTLTLSSGTKLQLAKTTTRLPWKLVTGKSAGMMAGSDLYETSPYNNAWRGPIDLEDTFSVSYNDKRIGTINFLGPVGGDGGLYWKGYTTLHLWNTNTYSGKTTVSAENGNSEPLHLHCGRALPINENGTILEDCSLVMHGDDFYELPVIGVDNGDEQVISGGRSGGFMAGLEKTGSGVLVYDSVVAVTGRTEILEGTLKLLEYTPRRQAGGIRQGECNFDSDSYSSPGANYYWGNYARTYPAVTRTLDSLHYAYTAVQPLWEEKHAMSRYEGYIWNDSATNETWTFMSGAQNRGKMWIDDNLVLEQKSYQIAKFARVELKPGSHRFVYCMFFAPTKTGGGGGSTLTDVNWIDGTSTAEHPDLKWIKCKAAAFCRHETESLNHADYESFTDLLDGSLITVTNDMSIFTTRMTGAFTNLLVASGAVFDIGKRDMSVCVPFFSGEGTVMNGTLEIGERFTVRAAEVAEGALNVVGADLQFAEGAVVSVDDITALSKERVKDNPYVIAVTDGAFASAPEPDAELEEGRWKIELSQDSRSMYMYHVKRGISVVIR